jgi:hypothetical protein
MEKLEVRDGRQTQTRGACSHPHMSQRVKNPSWLGLGSGAPDSSGAGVGVLKPAPETWNHTRL